MYLCGRVRQVDERERERERERYRVIDKDEPVEVILVGVEVDVFAGYALQEVEGVTQEKMLREVWASLVGEWMEGREMGRSTCPRAVVA